MYIFNLFKEKLFFKRKFITQFLILSIILLLILNVDISFSDDKCDDSDKNCEKSDNPCCGEDSCSGFPNTALFISTTNGIQKRNMDGTLYEKLDPVFGAEYSFISSNPEGNIIFSDYRSGSLSTYDASNKITGILGSGYRSPKSIVYDMYWNMYILNSGKNEILKLDQYGKTVSSYALKGRANSIVFLQDQCTMLISFDDGKIIKMDMCSESPAMESFSEGYLKHAYTLSLLYNGEFLVADGENIVRFNINGKPIMSYDIPAHDHWFALAPDFDGTGFWCADYCSSNVWKFDIESGKPIANFNTGTPSGTVFGMLPVRLSEPLPEEKLDYAELNLKAAIENRSYDEEQITVSLRNASPPYEIINTQETIIDADGNCNTLTYTDLIKGKKYYIVINKEFSSERWSSEPVSFDVTPVEYEFGSSPDEIVHYGDLNQDGVIDLEDLAEIDNKRMVNNANEDKYSNDENKSESFENQAPEINEMAIIDKNAEDQVGSDRNSKLTGNILTGIMYEKVFFNKLTDLAEPCNSENVKISKESNYEKINTSKNYDTGRQINKSEKVKK